MALQNLVKIDVSAMPSVPNSNVVKSVCPGHTKTFKRRLGMQHHSVAIDHGVFNSILFDPGSEVLLSRAMAHDYHVQWFHCAKCS